jgi:phosphatidylserine decarboxylase
MEEAKTDQPLWLSCLGFLPRKRLSRLVGALVHSERPAFFAKLLRKVLISKFGIVTSEAEHPVSHYPSFGKFFARKLKTGARDFSSSGLLSPCDGSLEQWGKIVDGTLVQCKGKTYTLDTLLADPKLAKTYEGGMFMTIYLAPFNYHRVHWGHAGSLLWTRFIEGDLWPVNATSVEHVPELFCQNERYVSELKTERGNMSSVMVGATNVGWMKLAHLSEETEQIMLSRGGGYAVHEDLSISNGDEFGLFNMGSTVILLLDQAMTQSFDWSSLQQGKVIAGQVLGVSE